MSDQERWRRELEGTRLEGQRWIPARRVAPAAAIGLALLVWALASGLVAFVVHLLP